VAVAERAGTVLDLPTRWLEAGAGAPVVLLHGASLGSSADVWAPVLDALAMHGWRVLAPDLPGFGETGNPADHSIKFRMAFVRAFMDAIGVARAHVVGHSQSGRIPVMLAFDSPGRLEGIVVVGTGSLLPPLDDAVKGDGGEGDEGDIAEPTIDSTRAILEDNLFDRALNTSHALALRLRMSGGKNLEAFRARSAGKSAGDKAKDAVPLWKRLAEVPVPLRLIYGREDRGNAARRAARAREMHPGLDLHVVDRARHLVMWDAPSEFTRLVDEFAGRTRGGAWSRS
jgi:pimeloyl-ACP methyl ester carboxylesterase